MRDIIEAKFRAQRRLRLEWYMYFQRLKDLREDSDLTQKEIADFLHIKQNTYSQYENEQRQLPLSCLIALAKLYKTSTDYILGLSDEK